MIEAEIKEKAKLEKASKYIKEISVKTDVGYQDIIGIIATEYAEQYYNNLIEKGIIKNED